MFVADRRIATLVAAALLVAPMALALSADNQPLNQVADGEFDGGAASLRMPALGPFPLIVGGWGVRGPADAAVIQVENGDAAAEVRSRLGAPVHLVQDVPVATRAFRLHLEVQRLRGRQTVKLVSGWDRADPIAAAAELSIRLGANSLRIDTASSSWRVEVGIERQRWVAMDVVADTRTRLVEIYLDGVLVTTVPGPLEAPPQTLLVGPGVDDGASVYRYDSFRLTRLAEEELAQLRRSALRWTPTSTLPHLEDRLAAAAVAVSRGAETLAIPELRAAGRLLDRLPAADDDETRTGRRELAAAVDGLLELLQTP